MLTQFLAISIIRNSAFEVFVLIAILLGSFFFWKKARDEHYDELVVFDITLKSLLSGIVGARLLYILLHFPDFGLNLIYWLSIGSMPGNYWVGFFVAAMVVFIYLSHKQRFDIFKTLDLAVIGVAIGQAWFYLGMFLSSGGFGKVTRLPIGIVPPDTFEPRVPLSLITSIWWFLVFILLTKLEKKYRRFVWYQKFKGDSLPGFVFFVFIICFGLGGIFWNLLTETPVVVAGFNIDIALYSCLLLFGVVSLVARSGWDKKLGLDNLWWLGRG